MTGLVLILVAILNNWYMGKRQRDEQEKAQEEAKKDRDAAEERASDDRIAAEERASDDRAAAERRATADRIAAEKQASDDRVAAERRATDDRTAAEKRAADDRAILEANALKVAQSAQVTNLLATYKWAVELAFDENARKSVLGVEVLSVLGSLPAGSFGEGGTEIVAQTLTFIQDGYTEHPDPGDSSEAYPRGSSGSSGDGGSNA